MCAMIWRKSFPLSGIPGLLFRQLHDFFVFAGNITIALSFMGKKAVTAVLYPFVCVLEITSAFFPQGIKGAIAKKAVKIIRVFCFVAGEKLTVLVTEKRIVFPFPCAYGFLKTDRKNG